MYQLISAVGKTADLDGRYYPINLFDMPLYQLYQNFEHAIATIAHTSSLDTLEYLDLWSLPPVVRGLTMTLPSWFSINGNNALVTTPVSPIGDYVSARFGDVWLNDFAVKGANRNYHPDMELSFDQEIDILLTKSGVDYSYAAQRMVATVNGFLHLIDPNNNGLFIYNGGDSKRAANENQIGLLDFSPFGTIQTIPITDAMIYDRDGNGLRESIYLEIPVDLRTKTVFLSIGGYLHALDNVYSTVGISTIKIDFKRYGWIKRYYDSKAWLDYSSLDIPVEPGGRDVVDTLMSDDVIRKLLTMPQSFMIVLDHTDIDVGTVRLDDTDLPGTYKSHTIPTGPIMMSDGRLAEYRISSEHGQYAIMVNHYTQRNRILDFGKPAELTVVRDAALGPRRTDYSKARMLMITRTTTA